MPKDPQRPHWVDQLYEKHECYPYGDPKKLKVKCDGENLSVLTPPFFPKVESLVVTRRDSHLFILGYFKVKYDDWNYFGALLVAKRIKDNEFETVVWHELFPWALEHLALTEKIPAELK